MNRVLVPPTIVAIYIQSGYSSLAEEDERFLFSYLDENWPIKGDRVSPERFPGYLFLAMMGNAARLAQRKGIGKRDWYREGAEYFVMTQLGDGSWSSQYSYDMISSTCLAMIFLNKSTLPGRAIVFD